MKDSIRRGLVMCCVLAVMMALALAACNDDDPVPLSPQAACDMLNGKVIAGATITATALVAATAVTPEYCQVTGLIPPQLNFEMRLPTTWNEKLHYSGGGGYNGTITPVNTAALQQGYVDVASDSGHTGSAIDASFALDDDLALALFASLSVPTVMASAKEIVKERYGELPSESYFEGCSNGGREGLMTALRYPTLFDGIIAGAPALQFVGTLAYTKRTLLLGAVAGAQFTPAKLQLLSDSIETACDTVTADGIIDGIISNPDACNFDIQTIRCAGGVDTGDDCLSDEQIALAESITSPSISAAGTIYYAGLRYNGTEAVTGQWDTWFLGTPSLAYFFYDTGVKNLLAKNAGLTPAEVLAYDFDANALTVAAMHSVIDVTSPNLAPFASAGGKLILWHGSCDVAVPYNATADYYNGIVTSVGGQTQADNFMRFYVAQGIFHCGGGPGAGPGSELLPALDAWVTDGTAPGTLLATNIDPTTGAVNFSRPLCPYPTYPRYNGSGDEDSADSYTCTAP
ncbi:MAG: tannase/feruloyl esterase family alpha/beta hydrolase [Syntrophales bacterium]|nr:tannase/feruloyl esterase family alpha/beta hydrolase [Syntrophales bacterium]